MSVARHPLASCLLACWLLLGASACGHGVGALPATALVAPASRPALFLGPEPDAAQIGFVSDDVLLTLTAEPTLGRVPVRIDGALRARGYVAADQLSLRVVRRGRVRGTPVYVGPGDLVRVLGRDSEPGRLRVLVTPRFVEAGHERALGRYEGSYPEVGLAASRAPASALPPESGSRFRVPAQTLVTLFEAPATQAPPLAELAAQPAPYEVRVLGAAEGWLAVRAGDGPYLIGWTQAALVPLPEVRVLPAAPPALARAHVPALLADEPGALKRVAVGTKVVFGEQVIGVFKSVGYARVQREFDNGFVDVFAAADDGLALRGLVRASDLGELTFDDGALPLSETPTPAEAR